MSEEREDREIRCGGEELGTFKLPKLMRAIERGDFESPVEFRSIRTNDWLPVAGIIEDFYPSKDKAAGMLEVGITEVQFLEGGPDDCPLCKTIAAKTYSPADVPEIPPKGCSCIPWCRLCIVAVR